MIEWIITSSALILLVAFLRTIIKDRVSPRLRYALWGLVLLRLLVPGTMWESKASVMTPVAAREEYQAVERIPRYVQTRPDGWVEIGHPNNGNRTSIPPDSEAVRTDRPAPYEWFDPEEAVSLTELREQVSVRDAFLPAWLAGTAAMGLFLLAVNLRFACGLKKNRRTLEQYRGRRVFAMEALPTPCLFGLFRPAIYLTPEVAADDRAKAHVLAHEYAHFRQGDHVWAFLRGVCLALHWYNPLVWLAAYLSRRDCELSCDEGAVRLLGEDRRADYGRTLVGLVARRTTPKDLACCATTMTGGKSALKERVALLVKRPRTTVWMACVVAAACIVFAVCTFTGAAAENTEDTEDTEPVVSVEPPQTEAQAPEKEEENPPVSFRREDIEAQTAQVLTDWLLSREETAEDHRINSLTLREWQFGPDGGIQAVFEAELMVLVPQRDSSSWWAGNTAAAEDMTDDFYRDYDGWLVFWRQGYAVLDAGTGQWSIPDIGTGGYTLDNLNQALGIDPSAGNYMRFRALPEDLPTELMDPDLPEGEQGEWLLLAQTPGFAVDLYRRAWDDQHVYLRMTNRDFQVFDQDLSGMELLPTLRRLEGDADMTIQALYRRYEGTYFNGTSYEPGVVADQILYLWNAADQYWTEARIATQPARLTEDLPAIADLPTRMVGPGMRDMDADMWLIGEVPEADIAVYYERSGEDGWKTWLRYGSAIQAVEGTTVCLPQLLLPELYWEDFDGDGDRELAAISVIGHGTGVSIDQLTVYDWTGEKWIWATHDLQELIEVFNNDLDLIYEFYEDGTAFIKTRYSSILLDLSGPWEDGYWGSTPPDKCVLGTDQVFYTCQDGQLTLTILGELLRDGLPYYHHGYTFEYVCPVGYMEFGGAESYLGSGSGVLQSDYAAEPEPPALSGTWRAVLAKTWAECDKSSSNIFAVHDVNGDGKEELIVTWMPANAISSAWGTSVYSTNGMERFHGHGELTFYSNGAISEPWSHNQGPASAIWPYDLYRCNPPATSYGTNYFNYTRVGSARARSGQAPDFEEVAYADLDGDGMVFYIGEDAYREENPVDNAVYEAWRDQYLAGAKVLPVQYFSLTEDAGSALR